MTLVNGPGPHPLVVIGVPTFNRAASLERALRSALAQDYPRLQVVVSDNASTDGTAALCEGLAAADSRVRYLRQPHNIGGTRNFLYVAEQAEGDFYLWLADDDWLDAGFVSACVAALQRDPGAVLAGGRGVYHREDGRASHIGRPVNCRSGSGLARMFSYYRQVDDNAIFYGVMRSGAARRLALRNVMGGDWHYIAGLALQGRVLTLEGPRVHRSLGGASRDKARMVRALGLPSWQARLPVTLPLALEAARALREAEPARAMWAPWRAVAGVALAAWIVALKPWQALLRRPLPP